MIIKKTNFILFIILFLFGIYLCFIGGYGSDEDTLPMIGAFESMMGGNKLMASRFTPYPVAELGIGFLSYNFGSTVTNLVTYLLLIGGLIFFYIGICKKINIDELFLYLILCLTNPILYFDNLEPMDYSWAFFPLALGIFALRKNFFELAVILFGISIGTRIYFLIFVFVSIMYFDYNIKISLSRKIQFFFLSWFVGGLFYLPIWFENSMGFAWLTAVTPNEQGFSGLIARFFYKLIMSFSLISFFVISFFITKIFLEKKKIELPKILFFLCLTNLLIFIFIPAEISYLQPFLISFLLICLINIKKKIIYFIIFVNLFSWFIELVPIKINYISNNKCDNVQAVSAKIHFDLKKGRLFDYLNTRNKISCWIDEDSPRGQKIIQGKPLK